jgi:gamma-glutamyl-gamma-aminobutyrate hydrolase PuuD|tara:strand:- start:126 stop:695 length:570 start_codon:yes stop_codon:yes gene_type:complete
MILVYLSDSSEKSIYSNYFDLFLGINNWKIIDDEKSMMGFENSLIVIGNNHLRKEREKRFKKIFKKAISNNLKIIGIEQGMFIINEIFGGEKPFKAISQGHEMFIGLGTKLASIIGGSGNVKVMFSSSENIKINHKADKLMASAINIETGFIEAIELKGKSEILGVLWPVFGNNKLPKGFENIVNYIVD